LEASLFPQTGVLEILSSILFSFFLSNNFTKTTVYMIIIFLKVHPRAGLESLEGE
jgi:hypothetical protein